MRLSLGTVRTNPNGMVIYRGPSALNGQPIVVVATGLAGASANAKTGEMLQVWILSDEGERPHAAVNSGADASVCGDCPHRRVDGWGSCYVRVEQAPTAVYDAVQRGRYAVATDAEWARGRLIRLGAYGDPAAVPPEVWEAIVAVAAGHTGYTHQWRRCDVRHRAYLMASCDTLEQARKAKARGWKTFRVMGEGESVAEGEFACPASAEAGKRMDCARCQACRGGEWKGQATPAIRSHGGGVHNLKGRRFQIGQKAMRQKRAYRTIFA